MSSGNVGIIDIIQIKFNFYY